MRVLLLAAAVAMITVPAAAKDLITPVSERQLEARIALFQQEARLAPCDPKERICAMGRLKLADAALRLARTHPNCSDQDCAARKSGRTAVADSVWSGYVDANALHDLYAERNKTSKTPSAEATAAYVEAVKLSLANSTCPKDVKACAVGQLAYLVEIDQLVRFQYDVCQKLGIEKGAQARDTCGAKVAIQMTAVDTLGRKGLERVVDRFGWPDTVHWGGETDHNAWLLAQHADLDQALQRKFLALIKKSFEQGFTPAESYAYIADRQASHDNKPQLYGTQGRCFGEGSERVWKPNPIEDEAHLDSRRVAAGMEPYAEYRQMTNQMCQSKL